MSSVGASLSVPQSAQIAPNTLPSPDALLARLQTPEDIQGAQRALNLLGAAPALVVDGVAGRRTQRALEQAFGQARSLPSPPERNERARRLQRALAALGYELGADGLAGQRTRSALADVQSQAGLPSTGTLDGPTMLALLDALGPLLAGPLGHLPTQTRIIDPLIAPANVRPGTSRPLSPAVGPTLREGDDTVFSSARPWVAILQARLGLADDGVLGPNTWNAIRLFNEAAGIEPVNQVGPETWVEIDRRFGLRPQWHRTFAPQEVAQRLREAVIERFGSLPFSDRHLIEKMVRGYGAMLSAPEGALIQNPHLFLTDFGLQGLDAQRGFVFNMVTGELVPIGRQRAYRFAVAHGVGSDQMEIDRPE
ncbi:MAG: peptidoglycan-binding domain-containing protein, partial [Myxococcota bacterium]